MNTTLFIDEEYLRNFAPVSAGVDTSLLWPFVITSQQTDILPLIGKALHDRLVASINANTVTADEAELLKLLRDALVWSSLQSYFVFGSIKTRGEGTVRQSGEGNAAASLEEITFLRNEARSMFYNFAERVKDHLCDNANLFPEYHSSEKPTARDNGPSMGIYLGPAVQSTRMSLRDAAMNYWRWN
jgi:hypothetical protein